MPTRLCVTSTTAVVTMALQHFCISVVCDSDKTTTAFYLQLCCGTTAAYCTETYRQCIDAELLLCDTLLSAVYHNGVNYTAKLALYVALVTAINEIAAKAATASASSTLASARYAVVMPITVSNIHRAFAIKHLHWSAQHALQSQQSLCSCMVHNAVR
jgi:hypothetical protein